MDTSRVAPLVLRLGKQRLRRHTTYRELYRLVGPRHVRSLTSTAPRHHAAPLPPSPEEVSKTRPEPTSSDTPSTSGSRPSPWLLNDSQPPPPRRSLRPWLWATAFFMAGVLASGVMKAIAFPPPLPEPGSEEDEYILSRYRTDLNGLPMVAELRKDRDAWREYDPYSQQDRTMAAAAATAADSSKSDEGAGEFAGQDKDLVDTSLTAGSLRGARGLAVQRAFYNAAERREITIVFFGGAVSGWPGVTHGGVLATVLKEAVERAANGPAFASRDTVTASGNAGTRVHFDCDSLTLNYKKPTHANNFYVIRAEVTDATVATPGAVAVKASIENALDGTITVLANGTCSPATAGGKAAQAAQNATGGVWSSISGIFGGGSNAQS